VFLTVDDGADGMEGKASDGVRRAQIILAAFYLDKNRPDYARKIHEDFAGETNKRLFTLMHELLNVTNR
jgi:hypothetical protein